MSNTKVSSEQIIDNVALGGNPTTTTQSASDNSTKLATTAYVTTAVANLVDSAPSSLNTLNELAAAMNDNASFFSTVLPLSGGTMTGALNMGSQNITNAGTIASGTITVTGGATFTDDVAINNGSPELYFGTTGNHYNWRIAAQEIVDAAFEIAVGSQDTDYSNDTYTQIFNIKNTGNATFAGTISSGAITSTADITAETGLNLESGTLVIKNATGDSSGLRLFQDSSDASKIYNNFNGTLQLGVGNTTALTIDDSENATFAGTISSGAITSSGEIRGNTLKAHVGTDTGTQLVLFADSSGHCFIAGHTLSFNVGANNSRSTQFALDSSGNATFSQNVAVVGDISMTGGGTIEAPSTSGSENLLLNAAGGIHLRIDSNGNSGDDQVFKVMKHTSALLFSVQENGYAEVAANIDVGGHLDCDGTASRVSARVQDMFYIGSEPNGATTTRYGNSSTRTYTDGGSSGYQGYVWGNENWFPNCFIPYSPNQVYRLSASIYQLTGSTATSGASSRHYLGVAGYDENFNFLSVDSLGTYQYVLASNNVVSTGNFLEVDKTLKGWQGAGQADNNKMDVGTVYIRPLWLANYQSAGATAVLTGFTIMPAGTVADDSSAAGTDY